MSTYRRTVVRNSSCSGVKIGCVGMIAFCPHRAGSALTPEDSRTSVRTLPTVSRASIERRLLDVSERVKQTNTEIAVAAEQLGFLDDAAEDARLRAIVAETPMEVATANEAQRHADALRSQCNVLERRLLALRTEQDELLDRMTAEPAPR